MDKNTYYKYLFVVGATWNILASLSFIMTSIFMRSAFPAYGITVPISMIWLQSFLFLVANLGIGYFIVSLDISKNHGIVVIGIIAKLGYFLINLINLLLDKFFNFLSRTIADDLLSFSALHTRAHGIPCFVAFSHPLLCRLILSVKSSVWPL